MGIIDKIEIQEKQYTTKHKHSAELLILDPYSYAGLLEELGIDPIEDEAPRKVRGYKVAVEVNEEQELIRLV